MGTDLTLAGSSDSAKQGKLQRVQEGGRLAGFGNMLRKELGDWFGGLHWLVQSAIWLGIVNGVTSFVLFVVPQIPPVPGQPPMPPIDPYSMGLTLFFSIVLQAGAVGAVISAQDAIVGEKQTGTAAWILSKPVSRTAFVLSKLLSSALGLLVFAVTLPAITSYALISAAAGRSLDVLPFVAGTAMVALGVLYFVAFTVMLGTLFNGRGPVIGISLGILLGGGAVTSILPESGMFGPLTMQLLAAGVASGEALPWQGWVSLAVTAVSIVVFSAVALWRFNREEL